MQILNKCSLTKNSKKITFFYSLAFCRLGADWCRLDTLVIKKLFSKMELARDENNRILLRNSSLSTDQRKDGNSYDKQ